jgi:hypothetical protein
MTDEGTASSRKKIFIQGEGGILPEDRILLFNLTGPGGEARYATLF